MDGSHLSVFNKLDGLVRRTHGLDLHYAMSDYCWHRYVVLPSPWSRPTVFTYPALFSADLTDCIFSSPFAQPQRADFQNRRRTHPHAYFPQEVGIRIPSFDSVTLRSVKYRDFNTHFLLLTSMCDIEQNKASSLGTTENGPIFVYGIR